MRALARNTDSATLSDGVAMKAVVSAQDFAARIDDLAFSRKSLRLIFGLKITINEASVVAVRHKANFLRLSFFRNRQTVRARNVAHLRLRHLAQWKHSARELLLRQLPQKVGLILLQIAPAIETIATRLLVKLNARVMPGRNLVAAKTRRKTI